MNSKLIGLVSLFAVFAGVACSEPASDATASAKQGATVKNAHAFRAPASAETKAALGIATWHLMTQPDANAVVIDGADANGVVKFSSVMRQSAGGKDLRIESYKQHKGEFSLVKQTNGDYVISNTIDMAAWMKVSQAFSADWKKQRAVQEYGYYSDKLKQAADIADKVSKVTGVLGRIARYIPLPQAQAASRVLTATSKAAGKASEVLDKASKVVEAAEAVKEAYDKRQDAKQDAEQDAELQKEEEQKAEDEKQDAEQDAELQKEEEEAAQKEEDEKQDAEQDAELQKEEEEAAQKEEDERQDAEQDAELEKEEQEAGGDDGTAVASADADTETGDGEELAADTMDQDLDAELEGGGDEGGGDEGGFEGGGDEGGGDEGGGGEAAGDEGGGGEAEFALHKKCRALSCSKTTKACICKKY